MLAHQILKVEYYRPFIFKDAHNYAKTCHVCQIVAGREKNSILPLQKVIESMPFVKWGLNFIEVVHPNSSIGHQFILIATDYYIRWIEEQACKNTMIEVVIKILKEFVIT